MRCLLLFCALIASVPMFAQNEVTASPVVIFALPDKLLFAGEEVPLGNYDTRESLQREIMTNSYLHSRTTLTLIAKARYFTIIEPIMKKYGIPDDFKYLAMAESGLNPNIGSSAGAAGLWQLMKPFATSCGLQSGSDVDERYHIEKSTEAACKYLLDAKEKFGSWTMAAASYNLGMAGASSRAKAQGVESYYDLFAPEETMRYVFRILAFKLITESPEAYGFHIADSDYLKSLEDYHEIKVSNVNIDWRSVARENGTNYKMLRELNHWIRDYTYTNKNQKSFTVKVPNKALRGENAR